MEEPKDRILGTHSFFYYYGTDHLLVNMYGFIMEGITKNQTVYASMEHCLYKKLLTLLQKKGICTEAVSFLSIKELILSYKESGLFGLKQRLQTMTLAAGANGIRGIRWISQPTFAMQEAPKQDFINLEKNLSKALKGTNVALICVYDFYDYLNRQQAIDEDMISLSVTAHNYRLYCGRYERCK